MNAQNGTSPATDDAPANTAADLEREMDENREALAETLGKVTEAVRGDVDAVKNTLSGVLEFREGFYKDPLVYSLGALSAGFALGYTVGHARKGAKGGRKTQMSVLSASIIDQLAIMGQGTVMPMLDAKIEELFGVKFSTMLEQIAEKDEPRKPKQKRALKGDSDGKSGKKKKALRHMGGDLA